MASADFNTRGQGQRGLKHGLGKNVNRSRVPPASPPVKTSGNFGYLLYPLVKNIKPDAAAKIMGMLLEMNDSDIKKLFHALDLLSALVNRAKQVQKEANSTSNVDADAGTGWPSSLAASTKH